MTAPAKPAKPTTAPEASEPILPDALYRLRDFQRVAGLKSWAMRRARRLGLRVLKFGNARFVKGSDFITLIERHGNTAEAAEGPDE